MTIAEQTKFERLFDGLKRTLETEGQYFSKLVTHSGEKGRLNETHLKTILSGYLPKKFALATGFAVSSKTLNDEKHRGPQLDIIIYDALNNAPLYQSEAFEKSPIEMVYGYIEVKTRLTPTELSSAFEANARVRFLQEHKRYANIELEKQLAPRFYLFAYSSDIKKEALVTKVTEAYRRCGTAHCHGLYVLQHDILISRLALGSAEKVGVRVYDRLAFPRFLQLMSDSAEGMIPQENGKPISFSMPRADMDQYFPLPKTIAEVTGTEAIELGLKAKGK